MSLSPRTKLLALGQNAKRKAAGRQASRPPHFLHFSPACNKLENPPTFSLGLLQFLCAIGACFYCMPRCLSFQKSNGHDEQQKQKLRPQEEPGAGKMPPKWIFVIVIAAVAGRSRLLNFIALQ